MVPWELLQIADSAFPTGGFAHSGGLEAAIHHGWGRTPEGLDEYLREYVWTIGRASLPFVSAAFDAPEQVWDLDRWIDATLTNHVANRASRTQGRTLLYALSQTFDEPAIARYAARARSREVAAHLAPMFGASLRALAFERHDVLALHLYLGLRGVASAAVRLGVAGPHEAQRLLRKQSETLDAVLVECAHLTPDSAATVAPLLDVFAATHDRLYVRLFQS